MGGDSGMYYIPYPGRHSTVYAWKAALKSQLDSEYSVQTFNAQNFRWSDAQYIDILPASNDIPNIIKIVIELKRTGQDGTETTDYYFYNATDLPQLRSNSIRIPIERDVWPDGIYFANANGIHVTRTTKAYYQTGAGYTYPRWGVPQFARIDDGLFYDKVAGEINLDDIYLMVLVTYDTVSSSSVETQTQQLFIVDIQTLLIYITGLSSPSLNAARLRYAIEAIGQVYQVTLSINYDAIIQKMWIIPKVDGIMPSSYPTISMDTYGYSIAEDKYIYMQVPLYPANYINVTRNHRYFIGSTNINRNNNFEQVTFETDTEINNATGCTITFGTYGKQVELPCAVGYGAVSEIFEFSSSGISVFLDIYGEITDISEEFELTFISNNTTLTSAQATAKSLSNIVSLIGVGGSAVAGIASGGYGIAAAAGAAGQAGNIISSMLGYDKGRKFNRASGAAPGWTTFENIIENSSGYYLMYRIHRTPHNINSSNYGPSAECEYYIAQHGAETDMYIRGDSDFLYQILDGGYAATNSARICTRSSNKNIIACECDITGVPDAVANKIQSDLAAGINIEMI